MPHRFYHSRYFKHPLPILHAPLFTEDGPIWNLLPKLNGHLLRLLARHHPGNHGTIKGSAYIGENVYIGKGTIISHGVSITGPAWIGENCYLAPGCYIRENTILSDNVIAGNACEFKNCLIFDYAEIPHWNYVGDSILGHKAHLGAGVILSNYRLDHGPISVIDPDDSSLKIPTGLDKFGAIIGDHVDIGSNAVISPGSLIGPHSMIYPLTHFCGVLPENHILKSRQQPVLVPRHPA